MADLHRKLAVARYVLRCARARVDGWATESGTDHNDCLEYKDDLREAWRDVRRLEAAIAADHTSTSGQHEKMAKLFIGARVAVPEAAFAHAGVKADDPERQQNPHLTFHYCGTDMTDADVQKLLPLWEDVLAKVPHTHQRRVIVTTEYELFGKNHDVLVLKCKVSDELEDAVNFARAKAAELLPHMPASDFPFSAHVTLLRAGATSLPPPMSGVQSEFACLEFDTIVFWGDDYKVRWNLGLNGRSDDMPELETESGKICA